jgi:hypothetical protein
MSMDSQYIASPHTAAGALTRVATGTALKTLLQIGIPANQAINILGWGCSFRGVAAADPPGELYLLESDVAATVTSLTPDLWRIPLGIAAKCVGGTALTGYNASAEGTITASRIIDAQQVHPQTGYGVWFAPGEQPRVENTSARFLRIRANFSVNIDGVPWVVWDE